VQVFDRFDEMALAQDEIDRFRLFDGDSCEFHWFPSNLLESGENS
jgi:hypothetical protein